jgi:hypothetical protein
VDTNIELAEAVTNEGFFKTAFTLKPGEVSEPVLIGKSVLVLQLAEEKALDPQYMEMTGGMYDSFIANLTEEGVTQSILRSEKLTDNLLQTFIKANNNSL